MASSIDATKPISGSPTTASVRSNFSSAESEINALQTADTALQAIEVKAMGRYNGSSLEKSFNCSLNGSSTSNSVIIDITSGTATTKEDLVVVVTTGNAFSSSETRDHQVTVTSTNKFTINEKLASSGTAAASRSLS